MRCFIRLFVLASLGATLSGCNTWLAEQNGQFLASFNAPQGPLSAGKAHFRAGDFGLAEASYRRAVEEIPTDAEAWLGLAAAQDQLGRFDLADRSYERLEQLVGPTPAFLNNRGYSYLLRGDARRARRDLEKALALNPQDTAIKANAASAGILRPNH
jgi:Flp pilus assembly protein TadD